MTSSTYRVTREGASVDLAPIFDTRAEAEAYQRHLSEIDGLTNPEISAGDGDATHSIEDGWLMRRVSNSSSVPVAVGRPTIGAFDDAEDYELAMQLGVQDLAERGLHAVAHSTQVSAIPEDYELGVMVLPGDSTTPWHVSLALAQGSEAARFVVDMDAGALAAPGMTPDPKTGYAMWDSSDGRVALVFTDPDREGLEARVVDDFEGYLPEAVGRLELADVADIAQLVADVSIGWR